MSAVIRQMVLRKRTAALQTQAFEAERDAILAQAKGDKGDPGPPGKDGRGIKSVDLVNGELIVTYTDKKKHNAGRIRTERVVVGIANSTQASTPVSEESVPYAKRVDDVGGSVIYIGEALPGVAPASAGWRVSRITFVGDDSVTEWANGTAQFDKSWDDRATYAYL